MASKAPTTHEHAAELVAQAPETDNGPERSGRVKATPERRCIATGVRGGPERMIRFVLSPDGVVTPDLAAELPGRGAWVVAERKAIEKAVEKGAFSRVFKCQATVAPGLTEQVAGLVRARVLHHLGVGRRSGNVLCGFEIVREALKQEGCSALVEAADGASDGREKLLQILRAREADRSVDLGAETGVGVAEGRDSPATGSISQGPMLVGCFAAEELGMALGRERVVHACVRNGRFGDVWRTELARLSGFLPVWPAEWPGLAERRGGERGKRVRAEPNEMSPRGEE